MTEGRQSANAPRPTDPFRPSAFGAVHTLLDNESGGLSTRFRAEIGTKPTTSRACQSDLRFRISASLRSCLLGSMRQSK